MTQLLARLADVLDRLARLLGIRPAPTPAVVPVDTRRPGRRR